LPEARHLYQEILQAAPNQPVALHHLGVIAHQVGENGAAVDLMKKALAVQPNYAGAHNDLGLALNELGKPEDAEVSCRTAIAIRPDFAAAHNNLGIALKDQGKLDEAVASYRAALAIMPDFANVHSNLGNALKDQGKFDEAFKHGRRAVALEPSNNLFWNDLAASLKTLSFTSADESLWRDMLHLLKRPMIGSPASLVRPILSALRLHPNFAKVLELTATEQPEIISEDGFAIEQLSAIPLFLQIMKLSPIDDRQVERLLTTLRQAMLKTAIEGNSDAAGLPFAASLALQCFTNEYIYPESEQEAADALNLAHLIEAQIEKDHHVAPFIIAALGAYRPLHTFIWADKLQGREWPSDDIKEVILRQISEPLEERSLRGQIANLTAIHDTVSELVRDQYEENPYPRWIKAGPSDHGRSIAAVLGEAPLFFNVADYSSPKLPEILIAGCGTGQQSLGAAAEYRNSKVLAIDLSLNSLSYAQRKTHELGVTNIEYAQADIMELGWLDRQFDLIECVGVLHHLGDPLAGWRILVNLLRAGGVMKIALYSEVARRGVVEARSLIGAKGYSPSPKDIRQCRHDLMTMASRGDQEMARICNFRDFYSLSECRDLLFHVQEYRFTLPQIGAALKSLKLKFLGFELRDPGTLATFKRSYPKPDALTSLADWHDFELKNPETFTGMYQFWCQKL